jgi:hypothetical protein
MIKLFAESIVMHSRLSKPKRIGSCSQSSWRLGAKDNIKGLQGGFSLKNRLTTTGKITLNVALLLTQLMLLLCS